MQTMIQILREKFGRESFRPGQDKAVEALVSRKDLLAILPTGTGKSICYQVPALIFPGLTIVVSPLLALMQDQVRTLQQKDIRAACWNSTTSREEILDITEMLFTNQLKLLYLSPEKLHSKKVQKILLKSEISHLCVDEAHCISQWGHDFRPEYRQISLFIEQIIPRPVVSAFTATADKKTALDIVKQLRLFTPRFVALPSVRPNLKYVVVHLESEGQKRQILLNILKDWKNNGSGSALIYAATRHETEELAQWLKRYGFAQAQAFHAGLLEQEKKELIEKFLIEQRSLFVCTSAFGMGIDKSNVRTVIHHTPPTTLEAYIQEAGRAGRDGLDALCVLLYRPEDLLRNAEFTLRSCGQNRKKTLNKKVLLVKDYAYYPQCLSLFLQKIFQLPGVPLLPIKNCQCSSCFSQPPWHTRKEVVMTQPNQDQKALLWQLQQKRKQKASELKLPAYILGDNKLLKLLALAQPKNWTELKNVGGVGHARLFYWGKDILEIMKAQQQPVMLPAKE